MAKYTFETTAANQPESLQAWIIWATNKGLNGGTCIAPHIRCQKGFCDNCEYFEHCTVTGKKLSKGK